MATLHLAVLVILLANVMRSVSLAAGLVVKSCQEQKSSSDRIATALALAGAVVMFALFSTLTVAVILARAELLAGH